VPSGDYPRFRPIDCARWHAAGRTHTFARGICKSLGWASDWNWSTESHIQNGHSGSETACRFTSFGAAGQTIIVAFIFLPTHWFLTVAFVVAVQVFSWWGLFGPLRYAPSFLRKAVKIVAMSGVVFDLEAVVIWFNDYAPGILRIDPKVGVALALMLLGVWWVAFFGIIFARTKRKLWATHGVAPDRNQSTAVESQAVPVFPVPRVRFADVGGMDEAKQQIRELVESRLNPQKYAAYRVNRNGILLYGPRGSGKTFLAEATAGEFGLNFHYVSPTKLITTWTGVSEASVRGVFIRARANRPALLFIDEIDALGSVRQNPGGGGDPGGAGRSYNNMAIELMQSIDEARSEPGLVIMAATNVIDGLDEALIREGRFDVRIHVDSPDESTREKIFKTQLLEKPWDGFDLRNFARRTPGASAAKIRSLVDQAAIFAAGDGRKIEARDLQKALQEYGGKDRPLFQPVEWEDAVLDEHVEQELRGLIRLVSNPFSAERMGLRVPTGVLLLGPTDPVT
jgi:ATP-dependent Zn protease